MDVNHGNRRSSSWQCRSPWSFFLDILEIGDVARNWLELVRKSRPGCFWMFLMYDFFVIPRPVRKNGTTNNAKPPRTLARTVFSERRRKRSSFLSTVSSRFEDALLLEPSARLLERLSLCSFSCSFETWY